MGIKLPDLPPLLTVSDLVRTLPYKKSWIWNASRKGVFPRPIKLSPGRTCWKTSEVLAWLEKAGL